MKVSCFLIDTHASNSNTPHTNNHGTTPIATTKVVSNGVPPKAPPPPPPPVIGNILQIQYKLKWKE